MQAKSGKKKRDLIIVAVTQKDFDNMEDSVLMGDFHRGQVFIVREGRVDEFIKILESEQK